MNSVFLDTSGLVAVVNIDDQCHALAETDWRDLILSRVPLITTSLVHLEIGDGLSRIRFRQLAIDLHDHVHASPRVEIVQTAPRDEMAGWELFRQRIDKEWGMTDCVSAFVMRTRKVAEVFSFDHHFEQAGFNLLLKQ